QTILVGDSGVGKTSLLVQFDQGKFIPGSFSATVGIGFTVRAQSLVPGLCTHTWGAALFGETESMN
ncbi:RAB26 protein, partial [Menura novaehollandiae]|nr:RAB26 protein [Menura novaehollandiae]